MASNPVEIFENRAPVLVLGLGNILLGDDGLGPAVIEHLLQDSEESTEQIELIDGGTQGLALLGHLGGREAIIIVDALATGAPPGTIHRFDATSSPIPERLQSSCSTHAFGLGEAIELARALHRLPERVVLIGIEGRRFDAGLGLSEEVEAMAGQILEDVSSEARQLAGLSEFGAA